MQGQANHFLRYASLALQYATTILVKHPEGIKKTEMVFAIPKAPPMKLKIFYQCRYAPEKIEYGIHRYVNETNRLYQVRWQSRNGLETFQSFGANSCWIIVDPEISCVDLFVGFFSQVMDTHLKDHEWLAADQYTIADIANFTWVFIHTWSGKKYVDSGTKVVIMLCWHAGVPAMVLTSATK